MRKWISSCQGKPCPIQHDAFTLQGVSRRMLSTSRSGGDAAGRGPCEVTHRQKLTRSFIGANNFGTSSLDEIVFALSSITTIYSRCYAVIQLLKRGKGKKKETTFYFIWINRSHFMDIVHCFLKRVL